MLSPPCSAFSRELSAQAPRTSFLLCPSSHERHGFELLRKTNAVKWRKIITLSSEEQLVGACVVALEYYATSTLLSPCCLLPTFAVREAENFPQMCGHPGAAACCVASILPTSLCSAHPVVRKVGSCQQTRGHPGASPPLYHDGVFHRWQMSPVPTLERMYSNPGASLIVLLCVYLRWQVSLLPTLEWIFAHPGAVRL